MTRRMILLVWMTLSLPLILGGAASPPTVPDDALEEVASGYRFTEGPAVAPDGRVCFTDIPNQRIHQYTPSTGQMVVFREPSGRANGLMFDAAGRLFACEGGARRVTRTEADGSITVLADQHQGLPLNSPNDLDIDDQGGVYFTDPRYGNRDDMKLDVEAVYYIAPDGGLHQIITDLVRPNGIALSPDNQTLYVADNAAKQIIAYDITSPGVVANKRVFVVMDPEHAFGPDGMSVDKAGRLYVAGQGGVHVYDPKGKEVLFIPTPLEPTNVTLAARDDDKADSPPGVWVYITARSKLYRAPIDAQPRPLPAVSKPRNASESPAAP